MVRHLMWWESKGSPRNPKIGIDDWMWWIQHLRAYLIFYGNIVTWFPAKILNGGQFYESGIYIIERVLPVVRWYWCRCWCRSWLDHVPGSTQYQVVASAPMIRIGIVWGIDIPYIRLCIGIFVIRHGIDSVEVLRYLKYRIELVLTLVLYWACGSGSCGNELPYPLDRPCIILYSIMKRIILFESST